MPAWYLDANAIGYAAAAGSVPCRFTASQSGGYASREGAFVLTIERNGGVHVYRGDAGPHCADGVIEVGDRVTLDAQLLAHAGADSGCAKP